MQFRLAQRFERGGIENEQERMYSKGMSVLLLQFKHKVQERNDGYWKEIYV